MSRRRRADPRHQPSPRRRSRRGRPIRNRGRGDAINSSDSDHGDRRDADANTSAKPADNPASSEKTTASTEASPPEASSPRSTRRRGGVPRFGRRCACAADPRNFAGAPNQRRTHTCSFRRTVFQKLDAQKAPTLRSAHSAQRHVDRVREGSRQNAARPGAPRERAMAAKRSFSSARSPTSPQRPARQRPAIARPWALGRPKVVCKNEARAFRPPLAILVSAARNLPELRKSIMRGNLRRQYGVAGRVAWAEGGEAHFRTKVRYDSLDFGDQMCYVEVPRKIDPSKAVVQFLCSMEAATTPRGRRRAHGRFE